jgi:hypothetical protein
VDRLIKGGGGVQATNSSRSETVSTVYVESLGTKLGKVMNHSLSETEGKTILILDIFLCM